MIIIIKGKQSNGDGFTRFGWIECDVEDCGERGTDTDRKSLVEQGWFIAPGRHRCPKHYHHDAPGRGVEHRKEDFQTKVI